MIRVAFRRLRRRPASRRLAPRVRTASPRVIGKYRRPVGPETRASCAVWLTAVSEKPARKWRRRCVATGCRGCIGTVSPAVEPMCSSPMTFSSGDALSVAAATDADCEEGTGTASVGVRGLAETTEAVLVDREASADGTAIAPAEAFGGASSTGVGIVPAPPAGVSVFTGMVSAAPVSAEVFPGADAGASGFDSSATGGVAVTCGGSRESGST